jgi:hypothetical protein
MLSRTNLVIGLWESGPMVKYRRAPGPPDWRRWPRTRYSIYRRGSRHETIHAGVEPELAEAFKHTARSSILKRSGQTGSDPGLSPSPKNDRVRTGHRIPSHVNPCRRQPWNYMPTSNIKSRTYTECTKQKKKRKRLHPCSHADGQAAPFRHKQGAEHPPFAL